MSDRTYLTLGAVKPHVKAAAYEIGHKFDIAIIYGIGARTGVSDHPLGLALDFMVDNDQATGDQVADYVKQNWQRLGVKYEIWWQRIDNGGGWEAMEDRGSRTENHMDHVHVSFVADPDSAGSYTGDKQWSDPGYVGPHSNDQYPWDDWFSGAGLLRVFGFLVGLALIALTIWRMMNNG
jgi:hypothetical protein